MIHRSTLVAACLALVSAVAIAQPAKDPKRFKGHALEELGASGLLYDPAARKAYLQALGPLAKERWLARLDGPSPQNQRMRVAGADVYLVSACKAHDCEQNNTVLLYDPALDLVYGKVHQRGRSQLIGAPPPAVAAELETLWKREWRSPAR